MSFIRQLDCGDLSVDRRYQEAKICGEASQYNEMVGLPGLPLEPRGHGNAIYKVGKRDMGEHGEATNTAGCPQVRCISSLYSPKNPDTRTVSGVGVGGVPARVSDVIPYTMYYDNLLRQHPTPGIWGPFPRS